MYCSNKKCSLKSDNEGYIVCWLCTLSYHLKCVGLNARVGDALSMNVGLRWSCDDCRVADSEICKMVQLTRTGLDAIAIELSSLNQKFDKLRANFKNMKLADDASPKRKKTNSATVSSIVLRSSSKTSSEATPSASAPCPLTLPVVLVEPPSPPVQTQSASQNLPGPKLLRVVEPLKHIFVSRFAEETSESDIQDFIARKLPIKDAKLKVTKFKYSYARYVASFKISLPLSIYETVITESFWPANTVVHEFKKKPKKTTPVVSLPSVSPSSKN